MREIQDARRSGKSVRAYEAPCSPPSEEQRAFARGKDAGERGDGPAGAPFRNPVLARAWLRGWRFAIETAQGRRPLDTAKRLPAGRP